MAGHDGVCHFSQTGPILTWFTPLDKHSETRRQHLPDAAAVLCLQVKLWQAHKEHNKAVDCYAAALKLNPFMWDAFLSLCETGKRSSTAVGGDLFF